MILQLCYSTNGTYFIKQSAPETLLTVTPSAALAESITAINPQTFTTDENPSAFFSGAIPSTSTYIGLIFEPLAQNCEDAKLPGEPLTGSEFHILAVHLNGSSPEGTISHPGSLSAGLYHICYTVDSGASWVEQSLVTMEVIPGPATADSLSSVTPEQFTVGTLPSFEFQDAIPSSRTLVSFVLDSEIDCNERQGVTAINASGPIQLSSPLGFAENYKVFFLFPPSPFFFSFLLFTSLPFLPFCVFSSFFLSFFLFVLFLLFCSFLFVLCFQLN